MTAERRLVVWTVVFIGLVGVTGVGATEDPCVVLTSTSIAEVADRFALDRDQIRWLGERHRSGTLRGPEDLAGLPGAGPDLRDDLEDVWCWGAITGELRGLSRWRERSVRRESRLELERGRVSVRARVVADPGAPRFRGGALWRGRTVRVAVGTLADRRGLGLLWTTAVGDTRNSWISTGLGRWRVSTGLDPVPPHGVGMEIDLRTWRIGFGHLRNGRSSWRGVTLARVGLSHGAEAMVATRGSTLHSGMHLWGSSAGTRGAVEIVGSRAGHAEAVSMEQTHGPFRARFFLSRRTRVYPSSSLVEDEGFPGDRTRMLVEGRWQGGPGRFLRVSGERDREVERDGWMRSTSSTTLEIGERFRPGLRLVTTVGLRERIREGVGGVDPADRQPRIQVDLEFRRSPWRLRARSALRISGRGLLRYTTIRLERTTGIRWELRVGTARRDGDPPDASVYRRRAGQAFGWDRVTPGAALGGWVGARVGSADVEISADRVGSGWEAILALRARFTSLDRAP